MSIFIQIYTTAQITTERIEPNVEASPIGNSVSVKSTDAKYATGTRTSTIEAQLCIKETTERPQAQK